MKRWPILDPTQQNELLGQMTTMIVEQQSSGWREVIINYRHLGRVIDSQVGVLDPNGTYQLWSPSIEVWHAFQRLRGGMYREDEGTWFSVQLKIEPPSWFTVNYNWNEKPAFPSWPSQEEFALDLKRYPRGDAYMPSWFRENLGA